ncbi:MAG: hypothetical protein ACRYF5_06835 [Janthinobacterium lividum]
MMWSDATSMKSCAISAIEYGLVEARGCYLAMQLPAIQIKRGTLLDSMHIWLQEAMHKLSAKSETTKAIRYMIDRWDVIPNTKAAALSDMTLTAVMRRLKAGVTAHGFSSTFRSW